MIGSQTTQTRVRTNPINLNTNIIKLINLIRIKLIYNTFNSLIYSSFLISTTRLCLNLRDLSELNFFLLIMLSTIILFKFSDLVLSIFGVVPDLILTDSLQTKWNLFNFDLSLHNTYTKYVFSEVLCLNMILSPLQNWDVNL